MSLFSIKFLFFSVKHNNSDPTSIVKVKDFMSCRGSVAPLILNLGTRLRCVINFMGKNPRTHRIMRWMGPRFGLDALEKRTLA